MYIPGSNLDKCPVNERGTMHVKLNPYKFKMERNT